MSILEKYRKDERAFELLRFVDREFDRTIPHRDATVRALAWMDIVLGESLTYNGVEIDGLVIGTPDDGVSITALCDLMSELVAEPSRSLGEWRRLYWSDGEYSGQRRRVEKEILADLCARYMCRRLEGATSSVDED